MSNSSDTIAAIATPAGRGGVGIVRVSGPNVIAIASLILPTLPKARQAQLTSFLSADNEKLDEGIAIYFPAPHSFTGEHVLELQGHGGPVVMDLILQRVLEIGARLAKPGEFSERAFLNDKIDLTQAEAVADLIDSTSYQAARCALRTLQGEFSKKIYELRQQLIELRKYVEAAIDFPDEEIDFLSDGKVAGVLNNLLNQLELIKQQAKQGSILQEGMTVVIAGRPNAGKSSLLNNLSGKQSAIVTDIAGTTRDILREYIQIDGIPVHVIDTAGLRESNCQVEQEGIRRAVDEIAQADRVLLIVDASKEFETEPEELWQQIVGTEMPSAGITLIKNKIDITGDRCEKIQATPHVIIKLCAKTGEGVDMLRQHLKQCVGWQTDIEGQFIARRRHLDALRRAKMILLQGQQQLSEYKAGELLAEDLREAQQTLNEITGEFTNDDLLGEIFSSFCIGK